MSPEQVVLVAAVSAMLALSYAVSRRLATPDGFFRGTQSDGAPPGLWMLVLSQVTTWIFAHSLLAARSAAGSVPSRPSGPRSARKRTCAGAFPPAAVNRPGGRGAIGRACR